MNIRAGKNAGPQVVVAYDIDWNALTDAERDDLFADDAARLFEWLIEAIPGGTFDRLCNRLDSYRKLTKVG